MAKRCRDARSCLTLSLVALGIVFGQPASAEDGTKPTTLVLAHYMPWYQANPTSRSWGWHWTMNAFDPDKLVEGKREIASQFYPLIGPYDSGDPNVLEYHLLLMKLAGIDGVIVDWYGLQDFRDYGQLHQCTQALVDQVERLGMKFVICYEDQTIPALIEAGRIAEGSGAAHAASEIAWLAEQWFPKPAYVRWRNRPVLLSFGNQGLNNQQWSECLSTVKTPVAYFSEHHRRDAAVGAFDWPIPSLGTNATQQFRERATSWKASIPVAFPRFVDIYAQAKLHDSYGLIPDERGATFQLTLNQALSVGAPMIQIATWNDWGEGTIIEPSREFQYRDLEVIQQMRREHLDAAFQPTEADLRLPLRLLNLRKTLTGTEQVRQLDRLAQRLADGQPDAARRQLQQLNSP